MRMAVGITTRERPYTLCACLAALFAQKREPEWLFVVDQSSVSIPVPQELALMLRAWSFWDTEVRYVPCNSRRGIWAGRKQLVKMADEVGADALLFADDDVVLLADAVAALEYELAGCGDVAFAMGTYVSSDLVRRGWPYLSELAREVPGPNYHWYVTGMRSFKVEPGQFATTIALIRMDWAVQAYREVEEACPDMLIEEGAFVPSDDSAIGAWLAMLGFEGVMVPACRGVHIAPDTGEDQRSGMRLDWLNRKVRNDLGTVV